MVDVEEPNGVNGADNKDKLTESSKQLSQNDDKKKDSKPQGVATVGQVFSFVDSPQTKWLIVAAVCCAVITGATLPAMAFFFAQAFEDLATPTASSNFMQTVRELAYTFMVLGAVVFVFLTAQSACMETAAGNMTRCLQTRWFRALLRQDMAYYDLQEDVAGQGTILSTNGAKFRKGVGRKLAESVQFTVVCLGGLAYAFWASWQVSLGVLAVVPFLAISTRFLLVMNQTQTSRSNATYAKAGAIATTAVSAIRTILALDAIEKLIALYHEATMEAYRGASHDAWLVGLASGSNMGSFLLSYIVVTVLGTYLLADGVQSTGCDPSGAIEGNQACNPSGADVFGALMGITFAASVVPQISVAFEAFMGARAACYPAIVAMNRTVESEGDSSADQKKLTDDEENGIIALPKYVIDSSSDEGEKPASLNGDIEFRNVRFAYPARPEVDVFHDFSLKIDSGKTVALVGTSGSGKSSAVQLLERFYDPQDGTISVDGNDLKDLNVKWLRQHIGYVGQEPKLFAMTIRQNIASGNPSATDEQIEKAARMANAHDFIMAFPDKYETHCGDMGSKLSGGQKQRICLARVLVKNPRILLLDEATSALDSESEATVQEAIDELVQMGNMTTLIIAHRLSTIRNADTIAVVSDGHVVESGSHGDLLAKQGVYFGMVERQKLKTSETTDSNGNSEHGSRRESTVDASVHSTPSDENDDIIRFRDVHFEYPSRPDTEVFRGFNLTVTQGETLALVGPSGCGKSTAIQLIECFYHPTKGSVEYKGVDMKNVNIKWLRGNQLGLVSQEPVLFDTTIEENIKFGVDATTEEVQEAAKQANCHDFIVGFPDGYQTRVGQGSSLVSGGQKQRIAIARALLKKPTVLLLDEATSALDSESEKIVQATLDEIMSYEHLTCVVIAHRLSTIQNADRIAVVDRGKVREIGTHDELMAKPDGRYRRLQAMQSLGGVADEERASMRERKAEAPDAELEKIPENTKKVEEDEDEEIEIDKARVAENAKRTRLLGKGDVMYYFLGAIGGLFAGIMFPAWGFIFAYMIEVLYTPVFPCPPPLDGYADCPAYYDDVTDDMRRLARNITYGMIGVIASTFFGFALLYHGFGVASERLNQRVRDDLFQSLLRQEVAWFDLRAPGTLTSRLADDVAMLHAFAGEPVRTLVLNLSSVLVGVVISFVYMWPFALLSLGIIPFLGFGAEMEMKMYMGEDEGDADEIDENSPGGIVIETLSNIRTVASLTLEDSRADAYEHALEHAHPHPFWNNAVKGSTVGIGQFLQFWGLALMFWWGGWLLFNYPDQWSYTDYLISMFSLFFSLYGLAIAAEGATDREKAKRAAERVFAVIDRQSEIDPLSTEGMKDF